METDSGHPTDDKIRVAVVASIKVSARSDSGILYRDRELLLNATCLQDPLVLYVLGTFILYKVLLCHVLQLWPLRS